MGPERVWKRGERVAITYMGRTVVGRVEAASAEGVALMLAFEALLGGFAGHMPVLWHESPGEYRDIILGGVVAIAEGESKEGRFSA